MKIEFEIDDKDLTVLLQALESAASNPATTRASFDAIQKLLNEIRQDVVNGSDIFMELKTRLAPFTNGSPILMKSNFRTHLGISSNFIESDTGLINLLNFILKKNVNANKPGATPKEIEIDALDDAVTIEDLVKLIVDAYVAST